MVTLSTLVHVRVMFDFIQAFIQAFYTSLSLYMQAFYTGLSLHSQDSTKVHNIILHFSVYIQALYIAQHG